jgi:hypothetical protein
MKTTICEHMTVASAFNGFWQGIRCGLSNVKTPCPYDGPAFRGCHKIPITKQAKIITVPRIVEDGTLGRGEGC